VSGCLRRSASSSLVAKRRQISRADDGRSLTVPRPPYWRLPCASPLDAGVLKMASLTTVKSRRFPLSGRDRASSSPRRAEVGASHTETTDKLGFRDLLGMSLEGKWRTERDSNPRYAFTYTHFPGVRLQPLGHLSTFQKRLAAARSWQCRGLFPSNFRARYILMIGG
jgi:hypothetical protein